MIQVIRRYGRSAANKKEVTNSKFVTPELFVAIGSTDVQYFVEGRWPGVYRYLPQVLVYLPLPPDQSAAYHRSEQ